MATEEEHQATDRMLQELSTSLAQARKERATLVFADHYQYKITSELCEEIRSVGGAIRDAVNDMANSFDRACAAIERAAAAWEDKAVTS